MTYTHTHTRTNTHNHLFIKKTQWQRLFYVFHEFSLQQSETASRKCTIGFFLVVAYNRILDARANGNYSIVCFVLAFRVATMVCEASLEKPQADDR